MYNLRLASQVQHVHPTGRPLPGAGKLPSTAATCGVPQRVRPTKLQNEKLQYANFGLRDYKMKSLVLKLLLACALQVP